SAQVSHNIVAWSLFKENFDEKKHSKFSNFELGIDEKVISDKLSANPWKAMKLFELLGCKVQENKDFDSVKNVVGSVVDKRNNIVHHNDDANDISLSDVRSFIVFFKRYIESVFVVSLSMLTPNSP